MVIQMLPLIFLLLTRSALGFLCLNSVELDVPDCPEKGSAIPLSAEPVEVEISNKPTYFRMVSFAYERAMTYNFQICVEETQNMKFGIFEQMWKPNLRDNEQEITNMKIMEVKAQTCLLWWTTNLKLIFNISDNFGIETLLFRIELHPEQKIPIKARFRIRQYNPIFYFNLAIALTIVLSIGIISHFMPRPSSKQKKSVTNAIAHFDSLIPRIKVGQGVRVGAGKGKGNKIGVNSGFVEDVCSICLIQFVMGDQIRKTPCEHVFHAWCIDQWAVVSLSCPVCRTSLRQEKIRDQWTRYRERTHRRDIQDGSNGTEEDDRFMENNEREEQGENIIHQDKRDDIFRVIEASQTLLTENSIV